MVDIKTSDNEQKPMSINTKLENIDQKLDVITQKQKMMKDKPFKLKGKTKRELKNLYKKNKIEVIYLRRSGDIEFLDKEVTDGFIVINDKYYNYGECYRYMMYGKYPTVIIAEWDIEPFGLKQYLDALQDNKVSHVDAQTILIRAIEHHDFVDVKKKSFSSMMWVLLGIGIIVVGYIIFSGGVKK